MDIKEPKSVTDVFYCLELPKGNSVYLDRHLHGNCQTYAIGNIANIIGGNYTKEEKIQLLKKCQKTGGKNQVLIDINRGYEQMIEDIFPKGDIVIKNQYISTNKSNMTIYLIKTDILYK